MTSIANLINIRFLKKIVYDSTIAEQIFEYHKQWMKLRSLIIFNKTM